MAEDINLDLDIDEIGLKGSGEQVARIALASARSFTRDGAAPTLSADCATYHALEQEVDRLKGELDGALGRASAHFDATHQERTAVREKQRSSVGPEHAEKSPFTTWGSVKLLTQLGNQRTRGVADVGCEA